MTFWRADMAVRGVEHQDRRRDAIILQATMMTRNPCAADGLPAYGIEQV
jgi:hypothetical protein